MTETQQRAVVKAFAKNWKDRGYEKGDSQIFWVELLTTVFGVTEISQFISFEDQVHLDHTSFIDGYIEKTHVMIEQKSINKSLTAAIRQSDGSMLTPFEQAKRYSSELPYSKRPRWIVTSNFQSGWRSGDYPVGRSGKRILSVTVPCGRGKHKSSEGNGSFYCCG